MKPYYIALLTGIGNDLDHIEDSRLWTEQNLNLQFYVLDNVEDLLAEVPSSVGEDRVLSASDREQLEMGNTIVNEIQATDFALNLLLFIHPVIENNEIKHIIFMHVPVNNLKGQEVAFARVTTLIAFLSAGLTIFIAWKTFGKSYSQLQDIKWAAVEVSKGNLDTHISQNSSDEVGQIIEVFNEMSMKLKDHYNRVKEFMEDFSHEIKSPLSLVKGYNQALMDQLFQDEEEQRNYYHLIDRETDRIQKLVQNFSDFTKLEADSVELERQAIVFAQSIEDIMEKYKLFFEKENIKLNMKLDYDAIIYADEDRLEQIIQNIIQNAIKYSKDDTQIDLVMERKANSCVLAISDNGIGISEKDLAVITKRFYRVNKVRSRKESGTGLGLPIVEKLMILHGGKLVIESQLGIGTTVKLEFPVCDGDDRFVINF